MIQELHSFVLGMIQGLTEFLPVSSSAHLIVIPWLFNWDDPGLVFDVALHLGTLLALLIFYWREWAMLGASMFNGDRRSQKLLMLLIVASVPGAIIGFLFEKQAETVFRDPMRIAAALGLMGLILWFFDKVAQQRRKINEITLSDALLIGISQAFAIVPGVSRSGSTITMARIVGIDREDAANFSFMMATPIIAGAGLLEARHLVQTGIGVEIASGFFASALFGLIAIAALIKFVRHQSYGVFAWYRVAAAIFILIIVFARR
jgi:undecaprenyl-diphosphatase